MLQASSRLLCLAHPIPRYLVQVGNHDRVYPHPSDLLADIVEIMKGELQNLVSPGVSYIQIDAPRYSYYIDPKWRDWMRRDMRQDPDAALKDSVAFPG